MTDASTSTVTHLTHLSASREVVTKDAYDLPLREPITVVRITIERDGTPVSFDIPSAHSATQFGQSIIDLAQGRRLDITPHITRKP